jgi:predicted small lipoprotein YifL
MKGIAVTALAAALLALTTAGALTGCGQKGALYLPHQKKTRVPADPVNPAPDTPAPEPGAGPQAPTASHS